MEKIISIFSLWMMLSGSLFSQNLTGLISEEVSEYQDYTAGPGDWTPESRSLYHYNARGQRTYALSMEWNPYGKKWETRLETDYAYDQAGREIRIITSDYAHFPDKVSSKHETRTYYESWTSPNYFEQKGSCYRETDYANETERITEQNCDRDTLTHFSSCRYYEYFKDKSLYYEQTIISNNQVLEAMNLVWNATHTTENENGKIRIYSDSTIKFYQLNISGIPYQTDYYHSDFSGPYQLIRQDKREYEYNDRGLLAADRTWTRLAGGDWTMIYETLYTYDSLGNIYESIFKDYQDPYPHYNRKTVSEKEMTDQGEIVFTTRYNWDFNLNRWIPNDKHGNIGSDQERYFIAWSNWDTVSNIFTYRFEEWWSWYETDEEHKNIIRNKGWDLASGTEFDYTREQGWKKRCNGETLLGYDLLTEGVPEYEFQNRRTSYAYFDLAECESGEPAKTISVYPNPCHGVLNIYAEERLGMTEIWMTDALGKVVYAEEKELTNFTLVDLEGTRPGMYFLRLNNGDLEYSGKFVLAY